MRKGNPLTLCNHFIQLFSEYHLTLACIIKQEIFEAKIFEVMHQLQFKIFSNSVLKICWIIILYTTIRQGSSKIYKTYFSQKFPTIQYLSSYNRFFEPFI